MDKIVCVGKNYPEHANELGDAVPTDPTYFLKPPSTLFEATGGTHEVAWPADTPVHHEVELVLRLARRRGAWTFSHYTFGLDMTKRDLQTGLKKAGLPWEKAKVFPNAAVVGALFPLEDLGSLVEETFTLAIDGDVRQRGRGREMRWGPAALLADLPRWFPLVEGDLLFTGTPAGVGPVGDGQRLEVAGGQVRFAVTARIN